MRVETGYEVEPPLKEDSEALWMGSPSQTELVVKMRDRSEMELVGGKALNISKLGREGFAVPEGFCITTKAYDYFMDYNSISEEDDDIERKIQDGVMPQRLVEVICTTYFTYLSGNPCAVRSSSPLEDLRSTSFAGQYKSLLNVRGENALLDAVKECWASLWSRSATEYRKKMGIKNEKIKMAVLVQEMLPAAVSGVLFTEGTMVIEGVWGLGDVLVGGKVIPDHFVVERDMFNVVERKISHKEVMSQIAPTGVEVGDVPEHLRDMPVLEDIHLQELCSLGKEVEELFGCPQDIEWALCNGEIILLQARPITKNPSPTVWSRANMAETQPGYVSYLSRIPENRPDFFVLGVLPLLECFGIRDIPEDLKLTDYIYGHVYVNMTAVHNTLGRIPGLSPELLDQSMGHSDEEDTSEESGSKPGLSAILKLLPGALKVLRFFSNLPKEAQRVIPYSAELIEDIRHRNLHDMTFEELDNMVWDMYDRTAQVFQVHACTALANVSVFGVLQKVLEKIGEEGAENLLTMGLEGMSSSQLGVDMWKLADSARKSSRVSELILSKRENILEELEQFPEGIDFLKEMNKFMERFGDRCSQELELSVPRWEEAPSFVLSMVAGYLNARVDPLKTLEEQKRIREETTDRILKNLSRNPLKLIFEKILEKSQQFMVARENLKTSWVRCISAMRIVYLAIAEKMVEKGVLQNRDDIFFLKMTEVSDIIAGSLEKEQLEALMEERKREEEEFRHLDVPLTIVGTPPPLEELQYTVEPLERLEGTGCSYGVVTGKARVVLDPNECPELKEGEILIAPVTDPGWSPLFVTANGLVMEIGGTLSHGVIIAREYGIPAVVGVKNATKIIKTGQTVTVDGNNGVVYIRE